MPSALLPHRTPDGRGRAPPASRSTSSTAGATSKQRNRRIGDRRHGPRARRRRRRWRPRIARQRTTRRSTRTSSDRGRAPSRARGRRPTPTVRRRRWSIQRTDGDEHEIVLHDDSRPRRARARPSTETGTADGSARSPSWSCATPMLTCDDGSTPDDPDGDRSTRSSRRSRSSTTPDDRDAHRQHTGSCGGGRAPLRTTCQPKRAARSSRDRAPSRGPGWPLPLTTSPRAWRSTLVSDGDVHEVVARDSASAGCSGGAATVSGTGRRETDRSGLVTLVISAAMTCDDGSEPIPTTPEAEGHLHDFPLSWVHDRDDRPAPSAAWACGGGGSRCTYPPTLPEPGDQPADPVAAEEQVRAAFTGHLRLLEAARREDPVQ